MDPYRLDAAVAEVDGDPFTFQLPDDDRVWALPPTGRLTVAQVRAIDSGSLDRVCRVLDDVGRWGDDQAGLGDELDAAPATVVDPLLQAWAKHSGISTGESPASPT